MTYEIDSQPPVLVIGSTGNTGRRVTPAVTDSRAVYVSYVPAWAVAR